MWVLVAFYHWGSAGHDIVNLKMVLDACGKAATYQDGFRLVVSVAGESRGVSSSVMAPAMLQTVSTMHPCAKHACLTPSGIRGARPLASPPGY